MSQLTRPEATIAGPGSAKTVDELLAQARGMLPHRPSPDEALRAQASGALLVDIRGDDQRRAGLIPGALVIPRNCLEWRCDPTSQWRHPHHHPGGRLVFDVFAALAGLIRGLIAEGFALSGAAAGQHGQAAALLAWLAAHRTPRSAQIPAASAGCAVAPRPRSHPTSDPRVSGWYGGRPRRSLICCWMTTGAGRASTV